MNKILFWYFICLIFMLTWLGAKPVEDPFIFTSKLLLFFIFLMLFWMLLLQK